MMDKRYGAGWIRRAAGLILAAAMLCALTVSALGDDAAEELLIAVQEDITGKAEMTLAGRRKRDYSPPGRAGARPRQAG